MSPPRGVSNVPMALGVPNDPSWGVANVPLPLEVVSHPPEMSLRDPPGDPQRSHQPLGRCHPPEESLPRSHQPLGVSPTPPTMSPQIPLGPRELSANGKLSRCARLCYWSIELSISAAQAANQEQGWGDLNGGDVIAPGHAFHAF